jgi:RNA polymerase sigma-70 factor (ECF subfamily)
MTDITNAVGLSAVTDNRLVQAVAHGDMSALETLYTRYGLRLLAYLVGQVGGDRLLAEELLQDVMLAVWKGAPQFRGESQVYTWMLAIARNRAISARQRPGPEYEPLDETIATDGASPFEVVLRRATQTEVQAALAQLPHDQRETLELIFYHGLSGPEAAAVMQVAPGTVKSRLHRAKAMLHGVLRLREDADA